MPCSCSACGQAAGAEAVEVERGLLVRVLAVAQHRGLVPGAPTQAGKPVPSEVSVSTLPIQDATATSYVAVCTNASAASAWRCGEREAAGGDGREHVGVAVRRGDDRDRGVVLGRGADHRRAADVDLLDALVGARAGRHGLRERVEVGDHQVERLDAEVGELLRRGSRGGGRRGCRRAPAGAAS